MRKKLIELIRGAIKYYAEAKERWILDGKKSEEPRITGSLADHLLTNGVIVLPRKVGDTVYVVYRSLNTICARTVSEIRVTDHGIFIRCFGFEYPTYHIGKNVFLTREAAEAALRKEDEGK